MPQRLYHYTVRMSSWANSKEEFDKLKEWASKQRHFWTNFMGHNDLSAFAFWAEPKVVAELFEQQGWSIHSLSLDVGAGAMPQEEQL